MSGLQEAGEGVLGELAALSDARPRNLYLLGLFVADHQLPESDALPATPEPTALPEPLEPAALPAIPVPAPLPAPTSSIGAVSAGTAAVILPVSHEVPAAASTAVPRAQQASACPTLSPAQSAHGSAVHGPVSWARMALLTYVPSDTSMAAAVTTKPTSAAAAQPAAGVAEPGAARSGPDGRLLSADSERQVADTAAPATAAARHVEPAAAAHPAVDASLADRPDRSTLKGEVVVAPLEQTPEDAIDRQTTRWGAEAASPLQPKHHWTGRLVNNAATEVAVFSVRPAQHEALSGSQAALAPAPARQQAEAVLAADKPAQPTKVKPETAAPSGDAVQPVGTLQDPAPAVGAEEGTRQAASGTAPEESQRSSDWEAALVSGKAPWRSAADAATDEAEAVSRPADAAASQERTEPTLEKPRQCLEPARASCTSHSRDESRSRRSPGRSSDRSRTRRRSTEERLGDRKRPHSGSSSSDRRKRREGRRTPAADETQTQPPLPPDAAEGAGVHQVAAPAADAAAFLASLDGLHAPVIQCGSAQSGENSIDGQPIGAKGTLHPTKLAGAKRRRRWDVVEAAGRQDDRGQVKRQRMGPDSDVAHVAPQPSYDMFSRGSQSPPRQPALQPANDEPRPPSQLPAESAPDGMPPPAVRSPLRCAEHRAWCAVKDEEPLPCHGPSGPPPPRSSAVADQHTRISSSDSPPARSLPPPPSEEGEWPSKRHMPFGDGPQGLPSPQHGSYASLLSAPRSPSPAWWTRAARPQAQRGSPSYALEAPSSPPPAAGLYPATEWARPQLGTGIDPLKWHIRTDIDFVRCVRTKLCKAGNACKGRLTDCAYAHAPMELLTPDDNMLLMEVAREWESRGIPAEWKHVAERQAALHGSLPATDTAVVTQRRSKDVNLVAPPAAGLQPDRQQLLPRVQPQQLPHSMLNEDVEMEESLMHMITVRLLSRCHPLPIPMLESNRLRMLPSQ